MHISQVSVREYQRALSHQRIASLSQLSVAELIEIGALASDEEMLEREMQRAQAGSEAILLEVGSEAEAESMLSLESEAQANGEHKVIRQVFSFLDYLILMIQSISLLIMEIRLVGVASRRLSSLCRVPSRTLQRAPRRLPPRR